MDNDDFYMELELEEIGYYEEFFEIEFVFELC